MMTEFLRKLDDPEMDQKKKISSSENFELVYLRHRYFRKSTNPSPERLHQFEEMICNISDKIYYRNILIFKITGFESEDLRNIGRINTVSFISMGGLKENPLLMEKFRNDHKNRYGQESEPSNREIFLRECYNLSKYLKQRLQEVAKFCEMKNTNIICDKGKKSFFIGNPDINPDDEALLMHHEKVGYTKITEMEFKKMQKTLSRLSKTSFLSPNGLIVRVVHKKPDYNAIQKFYEELGDNISNLNPEELMIEKENLIKVESVAQKNNL